MPPTLPTTYFTFRVSSPAPKAGIDWLTVLIGKSMGELLEKVLVPGAVKITDKDQVVHRCRLPVGSYFELPWSDTARIQIGARGANEMMLKVPQAARAVVADALERSHLRFEEGAHQGMVVFLVPFPQGANVFFTVPIWGTFGIAKE